MSQRCHFIEADKSMNVFLVMHQLDICQMDIPKIQSSNSFREKSQEELEISVALP